jgi:ribosomal protein S27AE
MGAFKDLTGQRFDRLLVQGRASPRGLGDIFWECLCDCGKSKDVRGALLRTGNARSCGCLHSVGLRELNARKAIDHSGERHGRLVVISRSPSTAGSVRWLCQCDCGGQCVLDAGNVGRTQSCGCLQDEARRRRPAGRLSPLWKPSISDEERLRGHIPDARVRIWREGVFRRDSFTCRRCGTVGGALCAHHIKRWAAFRCHRYTLWNGITLCASCHRSFHKSFGVHRDSHWSLVPWLRAYSAEATA